MNTPIKTIFLAASIAFSTSASAGIHSDEMSQCLATSVKPEDKTPLVQWIFTSIALQPDVVAMSSITDEQREAISKKAAEIFVTMVTVTCLNQTRKAIEQDGEVAIQQAFQVFSQVAGRGLFNDSKVISGLASVDKYFDEQKMVERLGLQP